MALNKKGIVWRNILIAFISIAIFFLAMSLFFGGDDSFFGKTSEVALALKDLAPNVTIGGEISGSGVELVEEGAAESVNSLTRTIQEMLNSTANDCFANYGNLVDFDERGTSISFNYDPNTEITTMIVSGGASGSQTIERKEFPRMLPCVIQGTDVPNNFYYTFLDPNSAKVRGTTFRTVNSISLGRDDGGYFGYTENRINYGEGYKDFEDGGWLFSPDNQHICFFPTKDGDRGCDGDGDKGLDDDCLGADDGEDDSLRVRYTQRHLTRCS